MSHHLGSELSVRVVFPARFSQPLQACLRHCFQPRGEAAAAAEASPAAVVFPVVVSAEAEEAVGNMNNEIYYRSIL